MVYAMQSLFFFWYCHWQRKENSSFPSKFRFFFLSSDSTFSKFSMTSTKTASSSTSLSPIKKQKRYLTRTGITTYSDDMNDIIVLFSGWRRFRTFCISDNRMEATVAVFFLIDTRETHCNVAKPIMWYLKIVVD